MQVIIQKVRPLIFIIALLGGIFIAGISSQRTAFAAKTYPAGTCFLTVQGSAQKIGLCSVIARGIKNNNGVPDTTNGTPLSSSKCYDITEGLSSQSIAEVKCDDTDLAGVNNQQMCQVGANTVPCVICPDGTLATPNNKPSDCTNGRKCGSSITDSITGKETNQVTTSIDLGCKGKGNPILDLSFAIIRFLSIGVGLVLVGSMVYAGIQYTVSRGDPNATAQAITRIRSNVIALLIFAFTYAIVNYLVPGQVLK